MIENELHQRVQVFILPSFSDRFFARLLYIPSDRVPTLYIARGAYSPAAHFKARPSLVNLLVNGHVKGAWLGFCIGFLKTAAGWFRGAALIKWAWSEIMGVVDRS